MKKSSVAHLVTGLKFGEDPFTNLVFVKTKDMINKEFKERMANGESLDAPAFGLGVSLIHFAAYQKHEDIVRELCHAHEAEGITDKVNIDKQIVAEHPGKLAGLEGRSACWIAASFGHLGCLKLLIKEGANVALADKAGVTPLMIAAKNGHDHCIMLLIEAGAHIEDLDTYGNSACLFAAYNGHKDCLEQLLRTGANHSVANKNYKATPCIAAVQGGYIDCLKLLLEAGANPSASYIEGATACMLAVECGRIDCLKMLIDFGADFNAANNARRTTLMIAASAGRLDCLTALIEAGAKHSVTEGSGFTAAMFAAAFGHKDCLTALIEADADVSGSENAVYNDCVVAVQNNNKDCLKLLLDAGAKPSLVGSTGLIAHMMAVENSYIECLEILIQADPKLVSLADPEGFTACMVAAQNGDEPILNLLIIAGANVNAATKTGVTACMIAAREGKIECLKLLLSAGANPSVVLVDGNTASIDAARGGKTECLELLLRAANPSETNNTTNHTAIMQAAIQGHTHCLELFFDKVFNPIKSAGLLDTEGACAFMWAVESGHVDCLKLLIKLGVDRKIQSIDGNTPLGLATSKGHLDVVKYLKSLDHEERNERERQDQQKVKEKHNIKKQTDNYWENLGVSGLEYCDSVVIDKHSLKKDSDCRVLISEGGHSLHISQSLFMEQFADAIYTDKKKDTAVIKRLKDHLSIQRRLKELTETYQGILKSLPEVSDAVLQLSDLNVEHQGLNDLQSRLRNAASKMQNFRAMIEKNIKVLNDVRKRKLHLFEEDGQLRCKIIINGKLNDTTVVDSPKVIQKAKDAQSCSQGKITEYHDIHLMIKALVDIELRGHKETFAPYEQVLSEDLNWRPLFKEAWEEKKKTYFGLQKFINHCESSKYEAARTLREYLTYVIENANNLKMIEGNLEKMKIAQRERMKISDAVDKLQANKDNAKKLKLSGDIVNRITVFIELYHAKIKEGSRFIPSKWLRKYKTILADAQIAPIPATKIKGKGEPKAQEARGGVSRNTQATGGEVSPGNTASVPQNTSATGGDDTQQIKLEVFSSKLLGSILKKARSLQENGRTCAKRAVIRHYVGVIQHHNPQNEQLEYIHNLMGHQLQFEDEGSDVINGLLIIMIRSGGNFLDSINKMRKRLEGFLLLRPEEEREVFASRVTEEALDELLIGFSGSFTHPDLSGLGEESTEFYCAINEYYTRLDHLHTFYKLVKCGGKAHSEKLTDWSFVQGCVSKRNRLRHDKSILMAMEDNYNRISDLTNNLPSCAHPGFK